MLICLFQTGNDLFPWGDHAIVEGETMRAWAGDQLLGTYSRYGWHHPGPALFYWMAPWHQVFGRSPAAMNASLAFLNAVSIGAIVAVVGRRAGRIAAFGAAAVLGLYVAQQGPELVRDFWIPHSVIFPFAALIVLTAAAASGTIVLVPLVALVASFLAETDLSVAPASAAVLVAGAVLWVATRGWRAVEWSRRTWIVIGATVLVSIVVWYPPLHEQLRSGQGNVTALREFFKQPDPGQTLADGINAVANSLTVLVGGSRSQVHAVPASGGAKAFLLLTLVLLVLGAVLGWRRERRFASALCIAALAAVIGEIYAVTQIRGELFTYLVDWSGAAGAAAWIGIGCALAPREWSPARLRTAMVAVAVLAAGIAAWNVADQAWHARLGTGDPAYANPAQKPIDLAVRAWMLENRKTKPTLYIPQNDAWPLAAGVYIDRLRHGRKVAIEPGWLDVFGKKLAPDDAVDSALVFTMEGQPQPPLVAGAKRIANVGGVIVYAGAPPG